MIPNSNPYDTNDAVYLFNISLNFAPNFFRYGWNLTHCQCAGKGAYQSTAHRGNHVVECCR